MRHMKEEGEKTRRLKAEKDKEVIQLKEKVIFFDGLNWEFKVK